MPSEIMIKTAKIKRPPGRAPIPAPDIQALSFDGKEPIERQVYMTLRRALISGAILPGSRISSRSIASSLGISTMPVREALKRLESDGALKSSMKSAFIVPYPTPKEFEEILQIRLQLEVMLAREAVPRISEAQIDKVEWLQDRMAQSKSWRQVLNYNQQMHFTIYDAADMPYALAIVENIWVRSGPILQIMYDSQGSVSSFEHHYEIIEGLRKRDPDMVEKAVVLDLAEAAEVIRAKLPEEGKAG
ncbi:GntR family transcriptional regulator [Sphingobium sp.]|uniref:GntR family transcriptional regulator n=1 Tax=Sphingobium sp. TaxID=1912891 RepID=UPI0028BD50A1|nr:GntR family transcriptional regulator [Sphingobium sp.]